MLPAFVNYYLIMTLSILKGRKTKPQIRRTI